MVELGGHDERREAVSVGDLQVRLVLDEQLGHTDVPPLHREQQRDVAIDIRLVDVGSGINVEFHAKHFVVPRQDMDAVRGRLHRGPSLEQQVDDVILRA